MRVFKHMARLAIMPMQVLQLPLLLTHIMIESKKFASGKSFRMWSHLLNKSRMISVKVVLIKT